MILFNANFANKANYTNKSKKNLGGNSYIIAPQKKAKLWTSNQVHSLASVRQRDNPVDLGYLRQRCASRLCCHSPVVFTRRSYSGLPSRSSLL